MRWNAAMAGLATCWGLISVVIASIELDAVAIAFLRLALAAATLALVALAGRRSGALRPGGRLPALVAVGAFQGVHWLLFIVAVKEGSVALAVLTFYAAPLFIALAAPVALAEPLTRTVLVAIGLGAAGIGLVAVGGEGGAFSAAAIAAGLGSAATYGVLVILSKRLLRDAVPPLTVAFWDCFVGGLVVAPLLLVASSVLPQGSADWVRVLTLGIAFTGLATLGYALILRHITALAAGLLTFLEPVSAIVLAWVLLDDRPGLLTVLGGCLVVGAGAVVVILEPRDARVADAPAGLDG